MNKLISVTLIRKSFDKKRSVRKRFDKKQSQLVLECTIGLLYSLLSLVHNVKQLRLPSFEFAISDLLRVWSDAHAVSMSNIEEVGA